MEAESIMRREEGNNFAAELKNAHHIQHYTDQTDLFIVSLLFHYFRFRHLLALLYEPLVQYFPLLQRLLLST